MKSNLRGVGSEGFLREGHTRSLTTLARITINIIVLSPCQENVLK